MNAKLKSNQNKLFLREEVIMSDIMQIVKNKDPQEREFHQAVSEVMESVKPVLDQNPVYRQAKIPERIVEPERVILFRVPLPSVC
jgi:hypothetical protein